MDGEIREVAVDEHEALIAWLGDTPETVQCASRLRRGIGRAWVAGPVEAPAAAVVLLAPGYVHPMGFGEDVEAMWAMVRRAEGWEAVDVPLATGAAMAAVVERETGAPPELIEELFFELDRPVGSAPHPEVRLLSVADVPLMEATVDQLPGMLGWRFGSAAALVEASVAAGAVTDGELVAVAFMGSWSERLGEVGIATRPGHQGRGLATAAAAATPAATRCSWLSGTMNTSPNAATVLR